MEKLLIETRNLVKTYGEREGLMYALNGVSIKVYEHDFLVILGGSGSGKSTLLNMIGGIDKVDSGEILVYGKDIVKYGDKELTLYRRNTVGFVYQFFNLINDITVYQNQGVTKDYNERKRRADIPVPPFLRYRFIQLDDLFRHGLYDSVVSVVSLVEHVDLFGVFVQEDVKAVSDEFELRHRLYVRHGFQGIRLGPYDFAGLLLLFLDVLRDFLLPELLALGSDYAVVLLNLLLQLRYRDVYQFVHRLSGGSGHFRPEDDAAENDRKLQRFDVLRFLHHYLDGNVFVEILSEPVDFLLDYLLQSVFGFVVF